MQQCYSIPLMPFLDAHKAEVKGMLLTEYNEAEAMRLFELDGERRGREEGENKMADLMQKLFALGRVDDAMKAASDKTFRDQMFQEFEIM